jgi:hypothetical protein
MTKMLIIAKAVLILFGIYTISIILYVSDYFSRSTHAIWLSSIKYALMIMLGFGIYQLLIKGDRWAHYLIGRQELKITGELPSFAIKVYRITVVMCGILIVYYAAPKVVTAVIALFDPRQFEQHKMYDDFLYATSRILMDQWTVIVRIVLGFYLLCGAPHFVRRQVRKTLIFINQKTGTVPQYPPTIRKED